MLDLLCANKDDFTEFQETNGRNVILEERIYSMEAKKSFKDTKTITKVEPTLYCFLIMQTFHEEALL